MRSTGRSGRSSGRGLLGMAFDPDYATIGKFYVFYTRQERRSALNGDIVVAEYQRRTSLQAKPRSCAMVLVTFRTRPNTTSVAGSASGRMATCT